MAGVKLQPGLTRLPKTSFRSRLRCIRRTCRSIHEPCGCDVRLPRGVSHYQMTGFCDTKSDHDLGRTRMTARADIDDFPVLRRLAMVAVSRGPERFQPRSVS